MINLLMQGERDVKTITDAMFGEGTYAAYMKYCERFDKADKKKAQMLALCERLGIQNPYRESYWTETWKIRYSTAEIRKLTAKERLDIHFFALMRKEEYANEKERKRAESPIMCAHALYNNYYIKLTNRINIKTL